MANLLRISCLLVALLSVSQAKDEPVDSSHIQAMAEKLTESLKILASKSDEAKEDVHTTYKQLEQKTKKETEDKVQKALEILYEKRCLPRHAAALNSLPDEIFDRFADCADFAQTLADFEELVLGVIHSFGDSEDVVCTALREIGWCTNPKETVLDKVGCITGSIIDMIKEVKDKTMAAIDSASSITTAANDIAENFKRCFYTAGSEADSKISEVVDGDCK